MSVTPITLEQYVDLLGVMKLQSAFQLPQYHYIREIVHPGEYCFAPFKIEGNGKVLLVPLIVRERRKGYPEFIVSFNSIASNQPEIEDNDYALIFELLRKRRPFRIKIAASLQNPHPFLQTGNRAKLKISELHTYVLSLPPLFEEWFASLSSNTRNHIRKAEKMGVKVYRRGKEGLENFITLFYERFFDNTTMLNTWSACFFYRLFDVMPPDSVSIYEATLGDKVVASALTLLCSGECFYHSSAYDKNYGQTYANHLIQSRIIEHLIAKGYKRYNIGGTSGIASLSAFKEKFGARRIEYHKGTWKNRRLALRKSIRFPRIHKFSIKKHLFLKKDLKNHNDMPPRIPPMLEWFPLEQIKDLERLIADGYDLRGKDERGKLFMSEKIARTRLIQKQIVFLAFRAKHLLHSVCCVTQKSISAVNLLPPIPLLQREAFLWHGNTAAFYRKQGYHKLFIQVAERLLEKRGFNRINVAIREDNIPAIKTRARDSQIIGSFYLLRYKKRCWCIGTRKLMRTMEKNAILSRADTRTSKI